MKLRVLPWSKRKKPAPSPADPNRLLRLYWATHDGVRDARRKAA
jgi:hypothetical protein